MSRILQFVAWGLLAVIVFSTFSPLYLRPETGEPAWLERFIAHAVTAACFSAGYPARRILVVISLLILASGIEAAQGLAQDRDPRTIHAIEKMMRTLVRASVSCLISLAPDYLASWKVRSQADLSSAAGLRRPGSSKVPRLARPI